MKQVLSIVDTVLVDVLILLVTLEYWHRLSRSSWNDTVSQYVHLIVVIYLLLLDIVGICKMSKVCQRHKYWLYITIYIYMYVGLYWQNIMRVSRYIYIYVFFVFLMSSHAASDLFSINNGSLCTICTLQAYSVFGNQTQQHKMIYVHLTSVHPICQQWHFTLARMVLLLILHISTVCIRIHSQLH